LQHSEFIEVGIEQGADNRAVHDISLTEADILLWKKAVYSRNIDADVSRAVLIDTVALNHVWHVLWNLSQRQNYPYGNRLL